MSRTKIEWTRDSDGNPGETWNPVLGCSKISPGCKHCYAINHVHRLAGNPNSKIAAANAGLTIIQGGEPNWTGQVRLIPERLEIPLRKRKPTRYFVNSLSDLFHEDLTDWEIGRVFGTMQLARQHTFQVLTKRSDRMERWHKTNPPHTSERFDFLPNVWMGVSVESRDYLWRIDALRRTPAAVRFLSLEPLLEDLGDISRHLAVDAEIGDGSGRTGPIDWVIVGGESGKGARPMHPDWVRSIRDQCVAAGVRYFFKQWGEYTPGENVDRHSGIVQSASQFNERWMFGSEDLANDEGHVDDQPDLYRVGKKAAGRLLDGRTWDEMPEVKHG